MVWFLETSGRARLTPRQACGLESAARYRDYRVAVEGFVCIFYCHWYMVRKSGLPVILVTFAKRFHLLDNVTCHLVTRTNITIRRVDTAQVYR